MPRNLNAMARRVVLVFSVVGALSLMPVAHAALPVGAVLWTDKVGDAKAMPWLDLKQGDVTCKAGTITFAVRLAKLDPNAPNKTRSYSVYRTRWEFGGKQHFADAVFAYGNNNNTTGFFSGYYENAVEVTQGKAKAGKITTGPGAVAYVTLTAKDLGLKNGSVLSKVTSEARYYHWYSYHVGVPTPNAGGQLVDGVAQPPVDVKYTAGGCTVAPAKK